LHKKSELSAKGAEYESQGQALSAKGAEYESQGQAPSAKGAEYNSQGQAPNNVRRVAPGKLAQ